MFAFLVQKGNVVLLAEAFLVCQPITSGLILNIQKKDNKGCKLFLPVSTPFQKHIVKLIPV